MMDALLMQDALPGAGCPTIAGCIAAGGLEPAPSPQLGPAHVPTLPNRTRGRHHRVERREPVHTPTFCCGKHTRTQRACNTHRPPIYLSPWVDIPAIACE